MFGLGFGEIAAILVLVIILVRPKDLPRLVRRIGEVYGRGAELYRLTMRTVRDAERTVSRAAETSGSNEPDGEPQTEHRPKEEET